MFRSAPTSHPFLLTALAMFAFAANSILCRMALANEQIDAVSFTTVRLVSGALVLAVLQAVRARDRDRPPVRTAPALALFVYAICFSLAYSHLSAASGALILFCLVQVAMVTYGLLTGERPGSQGWGGLLLALGGLVYLLSPGLDMPSPRGALLMAIAGVAWGIYSLLGRNTPDPVASTANNFAGACLLALVVSLMTGMPLHANHTGLLLAALSGGLASGLGYVIWYRALPALSPVRAASVQLSVPLITALAGVLLLAEPLSTRLGLSGVAILGGIAMVIRSRRQPDRKPA